MMMNEWEGNILLTCLVEKRTRNVPSAVAQKEDRVRDDLFRMSYIILLDHRSFEEDQQTKGAVPAVFAICMLRIKTKAALYGPVR